MKERENDAEQASERANKKEKEKEEKKERKRKRKNRGSVRRGSVRREGDDFGIGIDYFQFSPRISTSYTRDKKAFLLTAVKSLLLR